MNVMTNIPEGIHAGWTHLILSVKFTAKESDTSSLSASLLLAQEQDGGGGWLDGKEGEERIKKYQADGNKNITAGRVQGINWHSR